MVRIWCLLQFGTADVTSAPSALKKQAKTFAASHDFKGPSASFALKCAAPLRPDVRLFILFGFFFDRICWNSRISVTRGAEEGPIWKTSGHLGMWSVTGLLCCSSLVLVCL